jgi:hypothetical protein
MNHKRKRPKNARSGCLMCKPWKVNHFGKDRKEAGGNWKRRAAARNDMTAYEKGTD